MSAVDTLKSLAILGDWTDEERLVLASYMEALEVEADTVLLNEGQAADSMYVLESGRLRIMSRGEILGVVDTVSCFGEISCLLPDTPVTATVQAESHSTVYRVGRDDLLAVAEQIPKLWRAMFAQMSERLKRANKRLSEVLEHSPQGFLKLDREARITNEYSTKAIEYLGNNPLSGHCLPQFITPGDAAAVASWQSVFSMVFEDVGVPLSDLFELLTPEARVQANGVWRDLRLQFHPIYDEDQRVVAVDVGIEDVTHERELERAGEAERGRQATLGKIYQNPDSFFSLLRLIDEVEALVDSALAGSRAASTIGDAEGVARLTRELQMLKGFAGNNGLPSLQQAAQQLEAELERLAAGEVEVRPGADPALLSRLMRELHSLKGFAGNFGLAGLRASAHDLETELGRSAGGGAALDEAALTALEAAFARLQASADEGRALKAMIDPSLLQRLEGVALVPDQLEAMRSALAAGDVAAAGAILQAAESVEVKQLFACWPNDIERLCTQLRKEARLEIYGSGGMVPKPVFMALDRVLVHALNNAMDHGLEDAETRLCAEKDTEGVISVMVEVSPDALAIEIADDGRGSDFSSAVASARDNPALDQALVDAAVGAGEPWRVLLMPGFSTADQLTDLSGRGVGLDALAAVVTELGGEISIDSTTGQGFMLRIKVPLGAPSITPPPVQNNSKRGKR